MSGMKKQGMKQRIISFVLMLCFLILQLGGLQVFAETMPNLILEMDLSSYDGTAASISDATGNGAVFSQSAHVQKGTFRNASGNEVPFLDYYHEGDMRGRAWVNAPITEGLERETISCWTRITTEAMSWGALVAKVDGMGTDVANFEVHMNSEGVWTRPAGSFSNNEQAMLPIYPYTEAWTMFTFTREWNGDVVTWKTYINGVLQDVDACSGSQTQTKQIQGFYTYGLSSKFSYEGDGGPLNDFADFRVYDGILSDSQVAELYESTCQNFKEFDGTFAPNGAQISIHERELLVDLPSGISAEDAIVSVRMTDENDEEPEGGIDVSLIGDSIARVRFGKLKPNTTYTITGGRDGDCMVVTGSEYLLKEDFESWDAGEVAFTEEELNKNYTTRGDLTLGHSDNKLNEQIYTIRSNAAGQYLNVGAKNGHTNAAIGRKLDSYLTEGEIVYEMRVKPDNPGSSLLPISKIWDENLGTGHHYKDDELKNDYKESSAFGDFKKDSYGFWNLRCHLSVSSVTEEGRDWKNITVTFYDKLSGEKIVFTKILNPDSKVGAIELVSVYTNGDATDNISIDDILVYPVAKLDVVTHLDGFNPAGQTMDLLLSDEVSDETLAKNLITISVGEKNIATKLVSKNGRRITLQLAEHLDYDTEYSMSLSGLSLASGESADSSQPVVFRTRSYEVLANATVSTQSATFSLSNEADGERTILVILVGYNANGVICEIVPQELTLSKGNSASPTLTLANQAADKAVFVWDVTSGMKPIPLSIN